MTAKTEPTGLALLRAPFPPNQISKLPKPYKKDSPKGNCKECDGYHGLPAAHLDYVGHAALTDRLLDVDQAWQWEPLATDEIGLPAFDRSGGLWIRLTVCGVTRLGYGHAAAKSYGDPGMREKEVIGDALRNAAMRFGAALDLWHKGELHADEDADGQSSSAQSAPAANNTSAPDLPTGPINDTTRDWLASKIDARQIPVGELCRAFGAASLKQITYAQLDLVKAWIADWKAATKPGFGEVLADDIPY